MNRCIKKRCLDVMAEAFPDSVRGVAVKKTVKKKSVKKTSKKKNRKGKK